MQTMTLYGRAGWGSAIVEAQLAHYGFDFRFEEVGNPFESEAERRKVARINPVAQVPALILPDGRLMTESAAITLHLADLTGRDDLVPSPAAQERADFLRWLVFIVANIYPTFTFADSPTRYVPDKDSAAAFRQNVDAYACRLWQIMEKACGAPWFLGDRYSALDIYLAVMTRWRPKRAWFAEHAPKLLAAAERCDARTELLPVWQKNFPQAAA